MFKISPRGVPTKITHFKPTPAIKGVINPIVNFGEIEITENETGKADLNVPYDENVVVVSGFEESEITNDSNEVVDCEAVGKKDPEKKDPWRLYLLMFAIYLLLVGFVLLIIIYKEQAWARVVIFILYLLVFPYIWIVKKIGEWYNRKYGRRRGEVVVEISDSTELSDAL